MSNEIFTSAQEHAQWLASQSQLPLGFSVASTGLSFVPAEVRVLRVVQLVPRATAASARLTPS